MQMSFQEDQKTEVGFPNNCYQPYLMLKPYFLKHMYILTEEFFSKFGLQFKYAYKIDNWSEIALEIYKPTVKKLGKSFELGLLGHIDCVTTFWKNEALLIFFEPMESEKESFERVIKLKQYLRNKLPGGPEGKDYILLSNLDYVNIEKELKEQLPKVLPNLGGNPISTYEGAWDYFFFKYIHCPDIIEECKQEMLIYNTHNILSDLNFISKDDFDIMVRNCTYTIPRNLI